MSRSNQTCFYCHLPAIKLCDHVLGWGYRGEATFIRGGTQRVAASDHVHTCDMPLCARHADQRGSVHIKTGRSGSWDTFDYCPEHPGGPQEKPRVLKDEEAATLREAVRVAARRRLGRERDPEPPRNPVQGTLF